MLATVLKTTGIPLLVSTLSKVFKGSANPKLEKAGNVLAEVAEAFENGSVSMDEQKEANRHFEEVLRLKSEVEKTTLSEVNQSIRMEAQSEDPYVRRMRPTFGYIMALTWLAQMLAVAYVLVFEIEKAAELIEAVGALSPIWGVGLSVLGIYIYRRSEDKRLPLR